MVHVLKTHDKEFLGLSCEIFHFEYAFLMPVWDKRDEASKTIAEAFCRLGWYRNYPIVEYDVRGAARWHTTPSFVGGGLLQRRILPLRRH